jgi:hypothetical protein
MPKYAPNPVRNLAAAIVSACKTALETPELNHSIASIQTGIDLSIADESRLEN